MPELFTGRDRSASIVSEAGEIPRDVANPQFSVRGGAATGGEERLGRSYGGGVFHEDIATKVLRGRGPVQPDHRKYRYDVLRAGASKVGFEVSRDDRMSALQAGEALHGVHVMFGIDKENEGLLAAFDAALWFCHTVNGGSTLNPGRSIFTVPGRTQEFDYKMVVDKLGIGIRRFFRAYADDIMDVNKSVLDTYDPYDPVSREQWGWLCQVAYSRNLSRFPYLAHDSADACLGLNAVERSALAASKVSVISSTNNSADRLKANDRTVSADGFDSTLGAGGG